MRTLKMMTIALFLLCSAAWAENSNLQKESADNTSSELLNLDIPDMVEVHVRPGESLYDIARWSDVRIEALETLNGIDLGHGLKGGQSLVIPMTRSAQTNFVKSRDTFHDRRKTRYLNRRGGLAEVREYRVRTGDTVWNIAKDHGRIPLWLVKEYNPGVNLNRVRIGDRLSVPIMGDSLDESDDEHLEEDESADMLPDYEEVGC